MDTIYNYYFANGEYIKGQATIPEEGSAAYDVLRVINGRPLFFPEHVERLNVALGASELKEYTREEMKGVLDELIRLNGGDAINCNIKILAGGTVDLVAAFVQSFYPDEEMVVRGAKVITAQIERETPGIKTWHEDYKQRIDLLLKENKAFEALLVDREGYITEGSRSNVFFIKDDMVITSEVKKVLPGITRMKVVEAIERAGLDMEEKNLTRDEISVVDEVFLTGTSLNILAVSQIDNLEFPVPGKVTGKILAEFLKIVEEDLDSYN